MFHNCLYPLLRDRNSSPDNLLFNATYACRLCPPFCFNLLKLLHDEDELDKAAPLHTSHTHTHTHTHTSSPS